MSAVVSAFSHRSVVLQHVSDSLFKAQILLCVCLCVYSALQSLNCPVRASDAKIQMF